MLYLFFLKRRRPVLVNTDTRFGGGLDHMKHFGSTIIVKHPNFPHFDEGCEFRT